MPHASSDLRALRSLAERAARRGGEVVRSGASERAAEQKGTGDYVTEVDRASERAILSLLGAETPDIAVLAEEQTGTGLDGEDRYWVVDPLDGTTNFVHGFPLVGVSVALVDEGRPTVGAIHAPFLDETWVAARGEGAFALRDGTEPSRMRVSSRSPSQAVVGTGFPFRRKDRLAEYLQVFRWALERFEDLRRPGAAALDLAWVAAGVFDGFFELALSPWDVAAGGLLIEEAGGLVTDWSGGDGWLRGDILAGSPAVHDELLQLTQD
ncbi:MAG: inositol monophosphatase family protein [Actinomycetota bacterium]